MKKQVKDISIEVIQGNIIEQQDIIAIVNAANAELLTGGGVAGAIHNAAGPRLEQESKLLGHLKPGEAVITGAYDLPNKFVIHCLGPVYGIDKPEDKLLAECYVNALKIADYEKIESVAFPAISTGVFGYPVKEAAGVALTTIRERLGTLKYVKLIRIVLFSQRDLEIHEKKLDEIFG